MIAGDVIAGVAQLANALHSGDGGHRALATNGAVDAEWNTPPSVTLGFGTFSAPDAAVLNAAGSAVLPRSNSVAVPSHGAHASPRSVQQQAIEHIQCLLAIMP